MTLFAWALGVVGAAVTACLALLVAVYVSPLWGTALASAVAGVAAMALAAVQGRRERGAIRLRHCLECGASVSEGAAVCPRCQSVRIEEVDAVGTAMGGGRRSGGELPVTAYSPDRSGVIGWVDAAPPSSWGEGGVARQLRRWGIALIGLAALLGLWGAVTRG